MRSVKEKYLQFLNTDLGMRLYNEFKTILYSDSDSLVESLGSNVLQGLELVKKNELRVCDIGGADGKRIISILKFLHRKFYIDFHLDLIEQSEVALDAFDAASIRSFCQTNLVHDRFENAHLAGEYDLVFLIHSIFAFQNGSALEKVLSLPRKGGKVIVVSNSPSSFLHGLKWYVDEGFEDKRYEIDALIKDLDAQGIPYTYGEFQTRWAMEEAQYVSNLRIILDWISLGSYDSFSDDKKLQIDEYVTDSSEIVDCRHIFTECEALLVIPPL